MVLLTLLIYPIFYMYVEAYHVEAPLKHNEWGRLIFTVSLFILATCSASTFFIFGQKELFGREAGWRTFFYLPFLMSLGVGVGPNNAKAVFEAIWSAIKKRPSEFVCTPKYGVSGRQNKWSNASVFTAKRLWLPLLEIAMGVYMLTCIYISIMWNFGQMSIPFLLIFAGGYFYVGFGSLHALRLMNKAAHAIAEELADAEPVSQ